ncbi:helix-turn-helix domain-containing protein [Kallipyga gabonensis]|uniref:helix-turn-helix domain-containing protein n=1 Tax=Kallipyga gabonensis TaxID=1686287 RepID=UPI0006B62037|nr:helix-turn-helix transcriptional regulator [Kallipyga gabonensis]
MIGENIAYKRRSLGLKQKELAEKVGITASAISLIETGKNTPTAGNLQRIADALGTTDQLLMEDRRIIYKEAWDELKAWATISLLMANSGWSNFGNSTTVTPETLEVVIAVMEEIEKELDREYLENKKD